MGQSCACHNQFSRSAEVINIFAKLNMLKREIKNHMEFDDFVGGQQIHQVQSVAKNSHFP
jgi:hypothetical protein